MRICDFIGGESGAVTVDWVVMTAAVAGLGLAVTLVVSAGVEDLARDTSGILTGIEIVTEFFEDVQIAANDFAGGIAGDWAGGTLYDAGGSLGELYAVGPGETAELSFAVPSGANQAVLTFDLIGGDSLDSEQATVMINGQPVTVATGTHGGVSFADQGLPGVTVETTTHTQNQQLGGNSTDGWNESVTTVSITVDNPGDSVTLGVASSTDQAISDEYFGIDNVAVGAT